MRKLLIAAALLLWPGAVRADGCYTCGHGSDARCKDYCRYTGADTFDARKSCERKGCKIAGTSSCPTAANYVVCQAPQRPEQRGGAVLAAIPWCAPATLGGARLASAR